MAFLRNALAQLVDPEREDLRLFQFTVHLAELLCQLLALIGNVGVFRRRIFGGRRTELLHALLHLAHAGLEFIDICAKGIRRDVERLSETGERFSGGVLAVDGRFDRVERGLDRLERGGFGGLCSRGFVDGGGGNEKGAGHGPKNGLPAQSKPNAPDRHETVSPPWAEMPPKTAEYPLACALCGPTDEPS